MLGFPCDVGRSFHPDDRVDAIDLEVAGGGDPLLDPDIALHGVEHKPFCENVPEVQQQSAWQPLQAEHPQQLGHARIGLEELATPHAHLELPLQAWVVQRQGRAAPADLACEHARACAQGAGGAQAREQVTGVLHIQTEIHFGAAWPVVHGGGPATRGMQRGLGDGDIEFLQLPFACARCGG